MDHNEPPLDREEMIRTFQEAANHSDEFAELLFCLLRAASQAESGDQDFDYGVFRAELSRRSEALKRRLHDDARQTFRLHQQGGADDNENDAQSEGDGGVDDRGDL